MPIQSDNHFHTATASVQANTLLFVACSAASFLFPSWRAVSLNVNTIATFVFMNSQSKSNSCVNKCLLSHCRFRLLSGEAFTILISAAFLQIHLYIARLFKFTRGLSEGFPRGHSVSLSLSLSLCWVRLSWSPTLVICAQDGSLGRCKPGSCRMPLQCHCMFTF